MKPSPIMKLISYLLFCSILIIPAVLNGQKLVYESGGQLTPELASFDVNYYNLDIAINPADSTLSGFVDVHLP